MHKNTQMHLSKFPIIGQHVSNSNIPLTTKTSKRVNVEDHVDDTSKVLEAISSPHAPFASSGKKYDYVLSYRQTATTPFIASLSEVRPFLFV